MFENRYRLLILHNKPQNGKVFAESFWTVQNNRDLGVHGWKQSDLEKMIQSLGKFGGSNDLRR